MSVPVSPQVEQEEVHAFVAWKCQAEVQATRFGMRLGTRRQCSRGPMRNGFCCQHGGDYDKPSAREVALEAACIALMGGPDWRTRYECAHGVPMGDRCRAKCRLNPVRILLEPVR